MPIENIEWWQMIIGFATTAITIGGAAWAAWITFKTKQWEGMTKRALDASEETANMIKIRNEEITGQIEDLQATAENVRNTVNAIAKEGSIEPDELEIFEKEFGPKR